jgi:hypothetical protein
MNCFLDLEETMIILESNFNMLLRSILKLGVSNNARLMTTLGLRSIRVMLATQLAKNL